MYTCPVFDIVAIGDTFSGVVAKSDSKFPLPGLDWEVSIISCVVADLKPIQLGKVLGTSIKPVELFSI